VTAANLTYYVAKPEGRHKLGVRLFILLYVLVIVWVAAYGFSYYRLPLAGRAFHPLNRQLRPSGAIGIRLAILGVMSFFFIYLYPFRKRWKWLARIGKTRNWLDVHVVMGTGAPVLITFHAAFRMHGLAGTAYWCMLVVTASGFVGRYLYAQIPRRLNAAELSLQEMQNMTAELADQLQHQSLVSAEELEPLLAVPAKQEVERLSVPSALSGVAQSVRNLDDFRPKSHVRIRPAQSSKVSPNFTSSQSGNHYLTPKDVDTIYDINQVYNDGYTGTGQSIAVVGQSEVYLSDVENFQNAAGIAVKAKVPVVPGSDGGVPAVDDGVRVGDLAKASIMACSLSTLRLLQIMPPKRTPPASANLTIPLQMLLAAYMAIISPETTM